MYINIEIHTTLIMMWVQCHSQRTIYEGRADSPSPLVTQTNCALNWPSFSHQIKPL